MRYWDASALVPLVIDEPLTEQVRAWLREDALVVTWAWTRVELASAVERRARLGDLDRHQRRTCLDRFADMANRWDEVMDLHAVRARAMSLLARHALRAADTAQLAAALVVAETDPRALTFVCLDEQLASAADREGLRVLSR